MICKAVSFLFVKVTTVGVFVFTSTVLGVSSNKYPSGDFTSFTTYQSGESCGILILPALSVVYSPIFSPFCLSTINLAPLKGSPLFSSTFLICKAVSFLFVKVTIVGTFVFTSTVLGVSSNK